MGRCGRRIVTNEGDREEDREKGQDVGERDKGIGRRRKRRGEDEEEGGGEEEEEESEREGVREGVREGGGWEKRIRSDRTRRRERERLLLLVR